MQASQRAALVKNVLNEMWEGGEERGDEQKRTEKEKKKKKWKMKKIRKQKHGIGKKEKRRVRWRTQK